MAEHDRPRRLLVCDDDPLLTDLLNFRLEGRGYDVVVARDGAEALACVAEQVPDGIVLDAMMPVVDGPTVLRRLRADPATARVPVIMLTARKQERDILDALSLGADDYMVKPFIPEELVARIGRLIESRRA